MLGRKMFGRRVAVVAAVATAAIALGAMTPIASAQSNGDDALRKLLSYVPFDQRYQCRPFDAADPTQAITQVNAVASSVLAAVHCGPSDPAVNVDYFLFSGADPMNSAYIQTAKDVGAESTDEGRCPSNGPWQFGDNDVGHVACFFGEISNGQTVPKTVARIWTYDGANIFAYAGGKSGDVDAVAFRAWWKDKAGPLQEPDDSGLSDARTSKSLDDEVLAKFPKQTRKFCKPGDRFDPSEVASFEYEVRFFTSAIVTCDKPKPGVVDGLTYYSVDPSIIEDFVKGRYTPSQEDIDAAGNDRCPGVGTWTAGTGKKKHKVGTYTCYFNPNDDGSQRAIWVWTDTKQGILGVAANSDGDIEALHTWWLSDASGPLP